MAVAPESTRSRADRISPALVVRRLRPARSEAPRRSGPGRRKRDDGAGKVMFYASWRDSTGKAVQRTLGEAWLEEIPFSENVFIAKDERRQITSARRGRRRDRWQTRWQERRGRPRAGELDEP